MRITTRALAALALLATAASVWSQAFLLRYKPHANILTYKLAVELRVDFKGVAEVPPQFQDEVQSVVFYSTTRVKTVRLVDGKLKMSASMSKLRVGKATGLFEQFGDSSILDQMPPMPFPMRQSEVITVRGVAAGWESESLFTFGLPKGPVATGDSWEDKAEVGTVKTRVLAVRFHEGRPLMRLSSEGPVFPLSEGDSMGPVIWSFDIERGVLHSAVMNLTNKSAEGMTLTGRIFFYLVTSGKH